MVKKLPANTGDLRLIPGLGRSPREGNGNLLQYSCLENSMDRGVWGVTVHGVAESDATQQAHTQTHILGSLKKKSYRTRKSINESIVQ